jgi:hypothetical protein
MREPGPRTAGGGSRAHKPNSGPVSVFPIALLSSETLCQRVVEHMRKAERRSGLLHDFDQVTYTRQ